MMHGAKEVWREALAVLVPVLIGGVTHVWFIKKNWLGWLAVVPLDGGAKLRGRRLFGANKTLRGLVVMPLATGLGQLAWSWATGDDPHLRGFAWGGLLGLGYVLGELPNSFIKRRLDISPGAAARGSLARIFWLLDQVDSLAGIALVAAAVAPIRPEVLAVLFVLALVVHPAVAGLMRALGLKDRIG